MLFLERNLCQKYAFVIAKNDKNAVEVTFFIKYDETFRCATEPLINSLRHKNLRQGLPACRIGDKISRTFQGNAMVVYTHKGGLKFGSFDAEKNFLPGR